MEADHAPRPGSLVLVTGPSRSGKSRWAEHLVQRDPWVTYVATLPSRPDDPSWQERIARHRRRGPCETTALGSSSPCAHDKDYCYHQMSNGSLIFKPPHHTR